MELAVISFQPQIEVSRSDRRRIAEEGKGSALVSRGTLLPSTLRLSVSQTPRYLLTGYTNLVDTALSFDMPGVKISVFATASGECLVEASVY
jgi:hypothetical protein